MTDSLQIPQGAKISAVPSPNSIPAVFGVCSPELNGSTIESFNSQKVNEDTLLA